MNYNSLTFGAVASEFRRSPPLFALAFTCQLVINVRGGHRFYRLEAIAIRLEAIASRNKERCIIVCYSGYSSVASA